MFQSIGIRAMTLYTLLSVSLTVWRNLSIFLLLPTIISNFLILLFYPLRLFVETTLQLPSLLLNRQSLPRSLPHTTMCLTLSMSMMLTF